MNRLDLQDALSMVKAGLSSAEFIPVMTHFCFDGETVHAYNDVIGIIAELETPLNCAIPGDLLMKLLPTLPNDEVGFKVKENKVTMTSGKSVTHLPILEADSFVFKLPDEHGIAFTANSNFLLGLKRCASGCGEDAQKLAEVGITMTIKDGQINLYSTDNATVSHHRVSGIEADCQDATLVIPRVFADNVIGVCDAIGDEKVIITWGSNWILAEIQDEVTIFARLIDVDAYDFESIISAHIPEGELPLFEMPDALNRCLERSKILLSSVHDKSIEVVVEENNLTVYVNSPVSGDSKDEIELPLQLGDFRFKVNPDLMLKTQKITNRFAFLENVVVAREGSFTRLISHNVPE